jgi:hypothetical protein
VSFFEALEVRGPDATRAARQLQAWANGNGARLWHGRGKRWGSMGATFTHAGRQSYLFAAWTYGTIEIYFRWLKEKPPFDDESKKFELLEKLNDLPGIVIPPRCHQ